jgi:hypothetical protein
MGQWFNDLIASILAAVARIVRGTAAATKAFICQLLGCEQKGAAVVVVTFGQPNKKEHGNASI